MNLNFSKPSLFTPSFFYFYTRENWIWHRHWLRDHRRNGYQGSCSRNSEGQNYITCNKGLSKRNRLHVLHLFLVHDVLLFITAFVCNYHLHQESRLKCIFQIVKQIYLIWRRWQICVDVSRLLVNITTDWALGSTRHAILLVFWCYKVAFWKLNYITFWNYRYMDLSS